jgi:hypothetical protein
VVLRALSTASISDTKSIVVLISELFSLIVFLVGANFFAKSVFFSKGGGDLSDIASLYYLSLVAVLLLMMVYPLYRWIMKLGKELGRI